MKPDDVRIWLGIDVGKSEHWATAIDQHGQQVFTGKLPNDEAKLAAIYDMLGQQGPILVVVDQPATIGALAVALAQHMGIPVAYLPGLAMRRAADLFPGNAKTDRRDAFVIAQTAKRLPDTLRTLKTLDQDEAELGMLTGFDEDLARQITQTRNRIRGLFTQIHPALERVIGPRLQHRAIQEMLRTWPVPATLRKAGRKRIEAKLRKYGARRWQAWTQEILQALAAQTVVVTGSNAAATVIPHLASTLASLYAQRADVETQIEAMVASHPLFQVLTSMPGIGVRTTAVIIAELAGKSFPNAAALASYAGLAPRTRQSGTSIRSETASRAGNKRLKRALFLSAFAALRLDPLSRCYYDKKRRAGKRHNQALIALAHRRTNVIFAMLRDGTLYQPQPVKQAA